MKIATWNIERLKHIRYRDEILRGCEQVQADKHGRKFCVGDNRQSQEWRCGNSAESGELPLHGHTPGVGRGMRAAGVNAVVRSREFYHEGNSSVLNWRPVEGTLAPTG